MNQNVTTEAVDRTKRGLWTSASNAQNDKDCPGRHIAQRGIPEPPKSEDASQGTLIHEALASGDPSKLNAAQADVYASCRTIEAKVVSTFFGENGRATIFRHRRQWATIVVTLPDKH